MGRQKNIQLSGSVSHLVFYQLNGKSYVRAKPSVVKQTKHTRQRANDFGKAAQIAKAIRLSAAAILPFKPDRNLINQLNKAVYACLCNNGFTNTSAIPFITGFEFNEKSKLSERCKIKIPEPHIHKDGVTVQLPAFNISQQISLPAYTTEVNIKMVVAGIDLQSLAFCNSGETIITIDGVKNSIPAREINFPISINKGNLVLLLMAMEYTTDQKTVSDKRWLPVGIVKAWVY